MKNDEWILTKELGCLRQYGFKLEVERANKEIKNDKYNIVFQNTREILEPYCSIEEVIGIANSLKTCFSKIVEYNKSRTKNEKNNMDSSNNNTYGTSI